MNLSFGFIKSISNIYDEMIENGFSLVYLGEFSHEITRMFTSMAESNMEKSSEERTVQRKVFHVMVETLQNMNKHSDELSKTSGTGSGLFIIGKKNDIYYVITSNKVLASHKERLEHALNCVNSSTKEELKEMYKKQMKEGIIEKSGAGLGLIDIARKTEEKLNYQFISLDDDYYFFILKVEINTKKFIK